MGRRISLSDVKVCWDYDEVCGLEDAGLGEYTDNRPDAEDLRRGKAFDRFEGEDRRYRDEYRYFISETDIEASRAFLVARGESKQVAEEKARSYAKRDYDRAEAFRRGDWGFMTCHAEVFVKGDTEYHEITSMYLGGIESDCGDEYRKEVEDERIYELRAELKALGFTLRKTGGEPVRFVCGRKEA